MAAIMRAAASTPAAAKPTPSPAAMRAAAPQIFSAHKKRVTLRFSGYHETIVEPIVQRVARNARLCLDMRVSGPVHMPTHIRKITVLRSPFVDKKSREQFETRTHSRLLTLEGAPGVLDKYLEYFRREEMEPGIEVKVVERIFHEVEGFYRAPVQLNEPLRAANRRVRALDAALKYGAPLPPDPRARLLHDLALVRSMLARASPSPAADTGANTDTASIATATAGATETHSAAATKAAKAAAKAPKAAAKSEKLTGKDAKAKEATKAKSEKASEAEQARQNARTQLKALAQQRRRSAERSVARRYADLLAPVLHDLSSSSPSPSSVSAQ